MFACVGRASRLFGPLAIVVASATALAQSGPGSQSSQQIQTHFPSVNVRRLDALNGGVITQLVQGDFTNDSRPDVLALVDSEIHFQFGVDHLESSVKVGLDANALAKLPGLEFGQPDGWIAVGETGVERYLVDYEQIPPVQREHLLGGAWLNASRLGVFERTSFEDVVAWGASADGTRLFFQEDLLAGSSTPAAVEVQLASPLFDAVALNWSGGSDQELAVFTFHGLVVFDSSGAELFRLPAGLAQAQAAVLTEQSQAHQKLAVLLRFSGSQGPQLVVLDSQTGAEPGLPLSSEEYDLVAGDIDKDNRDDLVVLSKDAVNGHLVFLNQSSSRNWTFDMTGLQFADLDVQASAQQASEGLLFDIDVDGDLDLVCYSQGDAQLILAANKQVNAARRRPGTQLDSSALIRWDPDWAAQMGFDCQGLCHRGVLQVEVTEPNRGLVGATHLEIAQWSQADADGLAATGTNLFYSELPSSLGWGVHQLDLPLWNWGTEVSTVHFLMIRMVRMESDQVVEVGSTGILGVALEDGIPLLSDYVDSLPGSGSTEVIQRVFSELPPFVPGPGFLGGASGGTGGGDLPDLPPTDSEEEEDNTPPLPPSPTIVC